MDAQNAAEAASTKPTASSSSSSSRHPDPDRQKSSSTAVTKSPTLSRAALASSKASKSASSKPLSTTTSSNSGRDSARGSAAKAASPPASRDTKLSSSASRDKNDDESGGTDGNSEAETIVLSKDGSPAKPRSRKVIKHGDRPNGMSTSFGTSSDTPASSRRQAGDRKDGAPDKTDRSADAEGSSASAPVSAGLQQKKRRLLEKAHSSDRLQTHSRTKDTSNSHGSTPTSPPRSRNVSRPHSGSDSERRHRSRSPKRSSSSASRDRLRPPEKLVPYKRKASRAESDDEAESRKARRLRLVGTSAAGDAPSHPPNRSGKDAVRSSHAYPNSNTGNGSGNSTSGKLLARSHRAASQNRSPSPQSRTHRRSLSTHLSTQSNGGTLKKKRIPAPLQSTDYNSDESSASGSTHIRSSRPRNLATPATTESAISPAKIGPHKKHLDAHGQTFLARACARGEYELAKQRLQERPEDLNVADFAGNTPLQIAALNGYADIVGLLIEAGCNVDCVNYDKDTPLLDAVDNGHLEVVKLLLDAGVNPRKANVNGEEPLDRVDDDVENADAIRAALMEARKKVGERRYTSEEHRHETDDLKFLQGPDSPRKSPAPPGSTTRRAGTVRATKTSDRLLYMPMDDKTLRQAAGRGDEETVIRILQVRETFDDPESMVLASRGGHDVVLQLLLALGKANPDPLPVASAPPEHSTPMLAAIGQENIKVVSLLLGQSNFDPTKRFNGETYYEIARQRAGPNWKEEEDILKKAYDNYKKTHVGKTRSPARKDSESRRPARAIEATDDGSSRPHKRKLSSPSRERPKKAAGSKQPSTTAAGVSASQHEEKGAPKRSEHSSSHGDGKTSPKRVSSVSTAKRRQRDDRSSVASNPDRDTPPPSKQISRPKKPDSDPVAISSEGETVKPRRKKLISGRELKDEKVREKEREREREREKQRRASMASTITATPSKESSSPRESRGDELPSDKVRAEKHREHDRDRARQLKKEESEESSSAGENAGKRHRLSETPPITGASEKDTSEAPHKRRRLDADSGLSKEKRTKGSAPSDDLSNRSSASTSRDVHGPTISKTLQKRRDDDDRKTASSLKTKKREASSDRSRKESSKASAPCEKDKSDKSDKNDKSEKSIHVKSEDVDVEMTDVSADVRPSNATPVAPTSEAKSQRDKDEDKKKKLEAEAQAQAAEAKKKEEELQRRRRDDDDQKRRKEEKRREQEEEKRKQEEEQRKKEEELKKRELEEKKLKEEEEKQRRRKQLEEEERKRKEEEKKKREEEEEKQRLEAERARKLEEERKRREEEERLHQEQQEREAAEEARRKREEEQRLERERLERERIERERAEKERAEKERLEKERLEKERLEKERLEKERLEKERLEKERLEKERLEKERLEKERLEKERLERERFEQERLEGERKEQIRLRAEKEIEERRRRRREEEERVRIAKLPPVLRWLSLSGNPKFAVIARLFKTTQGVRYDCIDPGASGSSEGREQWMMNTQVALLLGDKDLSLSQYPSWRRVPVSAIAKRVIWRLESDRYTLTDPDLYELGKQLPGYYGAQDPRDMSTATAEQLRRAAWEQFSATDMFFVKVSDVMDVVATTPHLHDVRIALVYRELPEKEAQLKTFAPTSKWKDDPDADQLHGFAPGTKYYVNGLLTGEHRPGLTVSRKTPPPEVRVPRRGLVAVAVDDPDFARLCKEQNIDPMSVPAYTQLVSRRQSGTALSPMAAATPSKTNGRPSAAHAAASLPDSQSVRSTSTINGVNGTKSSN